MRRAGPGARSIVSEALARGVMPPMLAHRSSDGQVGQCASPPDGATSGRIVGTGVARPLRSGPPAP
jgi:hypothetical protein